MKSFEPLKVMAALASGAVLTQSYQKAHEYIETVTKGIPIQCSETREKVILI